MKKTDNFSKTASPSLRGVLNSIGDPHSLTRGLNLLLIGMALVLMSAVSFTAFAQGDTFVSLSQTVEQGKVTEYAIMASGFPNGTKFTIDWCNSSGGENLFVPVPQGVITSSPVNITLTYVRRTITTAVTTPQGTYYFSLMR